MQLQVFLLLVFLSFSIPMWVYALRVDQSFARWGWILGIIAVMVLPWIILHEELSQTGAMGGVWMWLGMPIGFVSAWWWCQRARWADD